MPALYLMCALTVKEKKMDQDKFRWECPNCKDSTESGIEDNELSTQTCDFCGEEFHVEIVVDVYVKEVITLAEADRRWKEEKAKRDKKSSTL